MHHAIPSWNVGTTMHCLLSLFAMGQDILSLALGHPYALWRRIAGLWSCREASRADMTSCIHSLDPVVISGFPLLFTITCERNEPYLYHCSHDVRAWSVFAPASQAT